MKTFFVTDSIYEGDHAYLHINVPEHIKKDDKEAFVMGVEFIINKIIKNNNSENIIDCLIDDDIRRYFHKI